MLGKSASNVMPTVLAAAPNIIYDGVVQPAGTSSADAIAVIANGNFNNVPLLIGVTSKEGTIFGGVTWGQNGYDRFTTMFNFNPDSPDTTPVTLTNLVRSIYLPETAGAVGTCGQPGYTAGYNYFVNVCGVTGPGGASTTTASYWSGQSTLLNALQSKQSAIYAYNFGWAHQPAPWHVWFGAGHTGDLPFIFGNFAPGWISFGFSNANRPGREALGLTMRNAIGAFIRKGDPNNSSLGTTWTPWTPGAGDSKRLIFDADQTNTRILMSTAESPVL
jgi:para-nitrobenzyl esterase